MAKTSLAIERKMQNRRNRQGFGYAVFYGILLAGITLLTIVLLANAAGSLPITIPRYLYESIIGNLYIYNSVALILMWLTAFLFPRPYQIAALTDNSWNMLYKLGVRPGSLVGAHIRSNLFSQLFTYCWGFAITLAVAYFRMADREFNYRLAAYLAAVGVLSLLIMITPVIAAGAVSRRKILLSLVVLLSGALVAYLLYYNGYHICAGESDIAASTNKLISTDLFGLVLIAALFTLLFIAIAMGAASARVKRYNVEDQDEEDLADLGVDGNMLVLTRGRSRYHVAISGPDIHNSGHHINVPALDDVYEAAPVSPAIYSEAPVSSQAYEEDGEPKRKKRGRRKKRGQEDDDAYDPEA